MSGGNLKAVLTCAAALLLIAAGALLFQYFNQPAAGPDDIPDKTADTDISGEGEAEGLHIVQLGTSNPNLLNYGGHAKIPQEYQYYIGGDNALYLCAFAKEDNAFYLDDASKVYDMAGYITLGDNCVYFGSTLGSVHSLCRMDLDGGNIEILYSTSEDSRGMNHLQYAKFFDGREYLYYSYENEHSYRR